MRNVLILAAMLLLPWIASELQQKLGIQVDIAKSLLPPRSEAFPEDRPPPEWDEYAYLAANPDVAAAVRANAFLSGYHHYQQHGKAEWWRGGLPKQMASAPAPAAHQPAPLQSEPAQPALDPASPPTSTPPPAGVPVAEALQTTGSPPAPDAQDSTRQGGLAVETAANGTTVAGQAARPPSPGRANERPAAPLLRSAEPPAPKNEPVVLPIPKPPPPAAAPSTAPRATTVTAIRFGQHPDRVRVVLDATGPVVTKVTVAPDGRSTRIDVPGVHWNPAQEWRAGGVSAVQGYRAVPRAGGWRVDMQTRAPVAVKNVMNLPPDGVHGHRIVLDLAPQKSSPKGGPQAGDDKAPRVRP